MSIRTSAALACAVLTASMAPAWAGAWYVDQGSDRAVTINHNKGFKVCDREYDGRWVYGRAKDFKGHKIGANDGGDRGCDRRPNPGRFGLVKVMMVCEEIKFWPDGCQNWQTRGQAHAEER